MTESSVAQIGANAGGDLPFGVAIQPIALARISPDGVVFQRVTD